MSQIRIDENIYNKLKEAAEFNKRTVGQHIAFLLDNEITFNEIREALKNRISATLSSPIDIKAVEKEMEKMKNESKKNKVTLENLTDQDLSTAKVSFQEKPDFKEPEEWTSGNWPTVE